MKLSIIIVLVFLAKIAFSEEKKVVYKYKQYEKFDLGDMEIKGNLIAPGDLSVKERKRKVFTRSLLNKANFDDEMKQDIKFMR